jgi:lysophospholipase L1-like esterase
LAASVFTLRCMKLLAPAVLVAALLALAPPAFAQKTRNIYVSVGDSYATGYQPNPQTGERGVTSRIGVPYRLRTLAASRGYRNLKLVNFGCAHVPGETTGSFLNRQERCLSYGPGGVDYTGRSQAVAAERYLRRNRDRVAFVTVFLGGNDVTSCVSNPDPVACTGAAAKKIDRNITAIGSRLRRAVGGGVPIVGATYPDVLLGLWVTGRKEDQDLAGLSVLAFKGVLNPTLKKAYARSDIRFVDVTEATGSYTPLDQMTTLEPYGSVPVAVAKICRISWFCRFKDIHLNEAGYLEVARALAAKLPRARTRR